MQVHLVLILLLLCRQEFSVSCQEKSNFSITHNNSSNYTSNINFFARDGADQCGEKGCKNGLIDKLKNGLTSTSTLPSANKDSGSVFDLRHSKNINSNIIHSPESRITINNYPTNDNKKSSVEKVNTDVESNIEANIEATAQKLSKNIMFN